MITHLISSCDFEQARATMQTHVSPNYGGVHNSAFLLAAKSAMSHLCVEMYAHRNRTLDIYAKDADGSMALHHCAQYDGLAEVLEIYKKEDPAQPRLIPTDRSGKTPLHLAVLAGKADNCRMLLEYMPLLADLYDRQTNTALHYARDDCLAALIGKCKLLPDGDGHTILHLVAMRDDLGGAFTILRHISEHKKVEMTWQRIFESRDYLSPASDGCRLIDMAGSGVKKLMYMLEPNLSGAAVAYRMLADKWREAWRMEISGNMRELYFNYLTSDGELLDILQRSAF